MKLTIKDLSTFKKLVYNGKISKMKLTHSKNPSVHIDSIRYIEKIQDNAFTLRAEDGSTSWFTFPDTKNIVLEGNNKVKIINGDILLLEYECFCDSEISEEDLEVPRFHRKSSIMKTLLK